MATSTASRRAVAGRQESPDRRACRAQEEPPVVRWAPRALRARARRARALMRGWAGVRRLRGARQAGYPLPRRKRPAAISRAVLGTDTLGPARKLQIAVR